jgi:hypothetical protein
MFEELTTNFDEIKLQAKGLMTYSISIGKKKKVALNFQLK